MGVVNDAELMRSWQQGDAAAFTELVRRWQQPMARFIGHVLGRPDMTADLCQEVFLRVFRGGSTYRAAGCFSTWLYRIAVNVARDAARRLRSRPDWNSRDAVRLNGAVPCLMADERAIAPDAVCERNDLSRAVGEALADLPEEQRLTLVLRHYEALPFEEIARLLGVPASTVKSRFAAGLKRLRLIFEQRGLGSEEAIT